jgi:hypothetical protein
MSVPLYEDEPISCDGEPDLEPEEPEEPTEQIINGGFETGDGTGWSNTAENFTPEFVNDPVEAYEGSYYARLPYGAGIRQDLGIVMGADNIQNWTVQAKAENDTATFEIKIMYDDSTSTIWNEEVGTEWTEIDMKAHVVAGKTVSSFWFWFYHYGYVNIDQTTLVGIGSP